MRTWFDYWNSMFNAPFSGPVTQSILPNFLSPQIDFNFAGNPAIENRIVRNVASYGRQLGLLIEGLLELVPPEKQSNEAIQRLYKLKEDIEDVKKENEDDLVAHARSALDAIVKQHPHALAGLLKDYSDKLEK